MSILSTAAGLLGTICGIFVVSLFGWTGLFFPRWTDKVMRSLQEWLEDEEI